MNVVNAPALKTKPTLIKRALNLLGIETHDHEWIENGVGSLRSCKHCNEHQYKSFTYGTWRSFTEPK